jgi:hypothetical protein
MPLEIVVRVLRRPVGKKFGTRKELENFIIANLIDSGKSLWAGDLTKRQADEKYRLFQDGRTIEYRLISELKGLIYRNRSGPGSTASGLDNLVDSDMGQHPEILEARMRWTYWPNTGDVIGPDNFVLLNMCVDFFPRIDKNLPDDRPWIRIRNLSNKYRPFIERQKIDVEQLRQAVLGAIL